MKTSISIPGFLVSDIQSWNQERSDRMVGVSAVCKECCKRQSISPKKRVNSMAKIKYCKLCGMSKPELLTYRSQYTYEQQSVCTSCIEIYDGKPIIGATPSQIVMMEVFEVSGGKQFAPYIPSSEARKAIVMCDTIVPLPGTHLILQEEKTTDYFTYAPGDSFPGTDGRLIMIVPDSIVDEVALSFVYPAAERTQLALNKIDMLLFAFQFTPNGKEAIRGKICCVVSGKVMK